MSNPDQIRAEIERTRGELGYDVDALADRVRPSSIAHRQGEKVKTRLGSIKESVMGSASDVRESGASAADAAKDAGHIAVAKAKGNPLAVALVAFGVGWLVSSLIPASEKEQELAETAKEKAAPLVGAVGEAAKESAGRLKEPAMEAANAVKDSATDAAAAVKDQAQSSTDEVKDSAQQSRDTLANG